MPSITITGNGTKPSTMPDLFAEFTPSEKRMWNRVRRLKEKVESVAFGVQDASFHYWPPEFYLNFGEKKASRFLSPEKMAARYERVLSQVEKAIQELQDLLKSEDWKSARKKWRRALGEAENEHAGQWLLDMRSGELMVRTQAKPKAPPNVIKI